MEETHRGGKNPCIYVVVFIGASKAKMVCQELQVKSDAVLDAGGFQPVASAASFSAETRKHCGSAAGIWLALLGC